MTFPFPFLSVGGDKPWLTVFDQMSRMTSLITSSDGWCYRQPIPSDQIETTGTGRLRLTLPGPTGAMGLISKIYIGMGATTGALHNFAATPTQLFSDGLASAPVVSGTNTIFETNTPVEILPTRRLVVSFLIGSYSGQSAVSGSATGTAPGWTTFRRIGDYAADIAPSGFSQLNNFAYGFGKVEMQS